MRRATAKVWAALIVAFLGLACTGPSVPGSVAETGNKQADTPLQTFQQMLDRRSAALLEGDATAFLEGLSPSARRVERLIAEGAQNVPLALIDPALRAGNVNRAQTEINDARTDLLFRYEGLPEDNRFRIRLVNDLQEEGEQWLVTRSKLTVDPASGLTWVGDAFEVVPPMWAIKEVDTDRSDHFLALHSPGLPNVAEILKLAERARAKLVAKMSIPPDGVHLVQLARDSTEYDHIVGPPDMTSPSDSVAVAKYEFSAASGVSALPVNRHMIVDLEPLLGDVERVKFEKRMVYPRQVFQHELAHLLLSRYTRSLTPSWVVEGAAMYLAGERLADAWLAGTQTGFFQAKTIEDLTSQPPPPLDYLDYAYANAAALYLVEEFGEAEFFEFYKGFKNYETSRSVSDPGLRTEALQGLLRIHYDISDNDLTRGTREYIRKAIE